jgi:hypothetical protein
MTTAVASKDEGSTTGMADGQAVGNVRVYQEFRSDDY